MTEMSKSPEFTRLWNEWLRTPDGQGYEAGWGDYANRWHAERGKVWVLERMLEQVTSERDALLDAVREAAGVGPSRA